MMNLVKVAMVRSPSMYQVNSRLQATSRYFLALRTPTRIGVSSQHTTWAPVGQTPVLAVVRGRQTRLSMAARLCYRPAGNGVAGPARLIWRTHPG
jgi:hypothetical protein